MVRKSVHWRICQSRHRGPQNQGLVHSTGSSKATKHWEFLSGVVESKGGGDIVLGIILPILKKGNDGCVLTSGNQYWCSACSTQSRNGAKDVPNGDGTNVVSNSDGAKRRPSHSAENGQDETVKRKRNSGVDISGDRKGKPAGHEVSLYPLYKPSNLAIDAPAAYISDMPSKGVRSTLIDALNFWLHVPAPAVKTITLVVDKLHNASLILDDLEDNSPLRRGLPSAHIIFGQAQSINSANFMFVRAVQEVAQGLSPGALTAVLEELENLYLGQSWDLYWKFNLACPTEAEYVNMIDHKTGGMFRMLLRVMQAEMTAAIPAGVDFERLTLLFGRFFQIRDDYMNFGNYAAQKGLCEDLDEGKFSYPVVYCLANHPEYRGHILGVFRQRPTAATVMPSPLSRETKAHLVACLAKSGAFEKTLECLRDVEHELEMEIDRLEKLTGEANPILRLCLAKLSVNGITPLG
ncbi:geranylgeranyl pyrophosphate synthase [Colletotrichum musicola]|uniref:Geranylgeranyl pyrophosphate synthase n=1 Tax=Colletotrichum musicola TaxID=2175873 RepID=A0A8H6MUS7_9PEZI|nr:geranylgeranyl pyrophosphate synthase [Colletotrichum musicola]